METPRSLWVSTKQQRIAQLAREAPEEAFTTLAHHIDIDWLKEAYRRTRKDGAPGVDNQTAEQYEAKLEENLRSLLQRMHDGSYFAPPVKRKHIPKGDGTQTRPIGIPTFEDKLLQRAVVMALEPIYEQDFLDSSYGFRPGRSAHQALNTIWQQTTAMGGGWVLEIDIKKFFDTLNHAQLREIVRKRVRDGVLLKLIGKWLNAGVMEDGVLSYPNAGSPQGGVVSPLLANAYLHEVLDTWFEATVRPRLKGKACLVRYADDALLIFSEETDARRVMEVLPQRFGKYGLTLHPEKTRLVEFKKPLGRNEEKEKNTNPGTFDMLGLTHFWGRSQKGFWIVKRKTADNRLTRSLKAISQWCRENRHKPLKEQQQTLGQKLRGHYVYYGIIGNVDALWRYHYWVKRAWWKWLSRRSQKAYLSWERFERLLARYPLPAPKARTVRVT